VIAAWSPSACEVNYWATWCLLCRKEMPRLDAFYRREPKSVAAAESVERRAGTKGNATSKARTGRSPGYACHRRW
jgi:hypothetical protein